jgi:hypothetical protein
MPTLTTIWSINLAGLLGRNLDSEDPFVCMRCSLIILDVISFCTVSHSTFQSPSIVTGVPGVSQRIFRFNLSIFLVNFLLVPCSSEVSSRGEIDRDHVYVICSL